MCLLIISSNHRCGHNIYRYDPCVGNTHYHCPRSWTELHARDELCSACARWAELALRNQEERIAWAYLTEIRKANLIGQRDQKVKNMDT
jgi:hypothetical protein